MSTKPDHAPGNLQRARWTAVLFVLDLVAFAVTPLIALLIRFRAEIPVEHALPMIWFMPVLVALRFIAAVYCDLYDFRRRLILSDFIFNAAGAAVLAVACGYFFLSTIQLYYWPGARLSRITATIDLAGLFLWFAASRAIVLAILRATGYKVRLFVIGLDASQHQIVDEIRAHAPAMLTVLESNREPTGNYAAQLSRALETAAIDQIVLADATLSQQDLHKVLAHSETVGAELFLLPGIDLFTVASTRVSSIAGLPLIPLQPTFLASFYRPLKRICDALVSASLLALSLPLCAIVALAIRVESEGPVLFSQLRVGLHRREFRVFKFRTMIADAEASTGPVLSTSGDPRITRIGRFLRKYRIDEWPQLWNVLFGEMSLVGPRPERPEFIDKFIAENPLYERRFLVRPGLTGLAQIHGRYDSDYAHKLRYDLIYINSISPGRDAQILLATVRTILTAHGAQ